MVGESARRAETGWRRRDSARRAKPGLGRTPARLVAVQSHCLKALVLNWPKAKASSSLLPMPLSGRMSKCKAVLDGGKITKITVKKRRQKESKKK